MIQTDDGGDRRRNAVTLVEFNLDLASIDCLILEDGNERSDFNISMVINGDNSDEIK